MKKLISLTFTALLFVGCTSQLVELEHEGAHEKTLVEVGWEASCVEYEIQDEDGNAVDVPQEVKEALLCFSGSIKLSPDQNFLVFSNGDSLKLYNFAEKSIQDLMPLDNDLEGLSCVWSDSGEKIACALVNQQKYEGGTKFFVINLNGDTKEYSITADTMADFICGASCYPGSFWFENENLIKYEGHKITAPGEIFDIEL